ncbi:MAG: N-acetyl-gamma-glutamyl-phosphate reductase [Clostridia bacterium]|nr:N-acetyl-gamma-glutamyl-phosphate reductase [Clostridia bacterium]
MNKAFIDGSSGTTGLRIEQRLSERGDIEIIKLPEELRKDTGARRDALNSSDVAFLCLPDAAAQESAELVENLNTVIIDTSTAHRINEGWIYGFAELTGQREKIASGKRIANPGCHASGFIALIKPLVEAGIVSPEENLSCFSLTGYSGGGKKMIAEYEDDERDPLLNAPRMYALGQTHKHQPEMQKLCALNNAPVFCPVVAPFYAGMEVTVSLFHKSKARIEDAYADYYNSGLVRFVKEESEGGFLSAGAFAGRDDMHISVYGTEERLILTARFDNLGKGASGAAIQNMNIALGADEYAGLVL